MIHCMAMSKLVQVTIFPVLIQSLEHILVSAQAYDNKNRRIIGLTNKIAFGTYLRSY